MMYGLEGILQASRQDSYTEEKLKREEELRRMGGLSKAPGHDPMNPLEPGLPTEDEIRRVMQSQRQEQGTYPGHDPWDRMTGFCCASCMYFAPKDGPELGKAATGRCRRHAPTMQGYPVVYALLDWCGDHKLGTNPSKRG